MTSVTPRLTAEESTFLTRAMTLGTGTNLPVIMKPTELVRLIGVIYFDTQHGDELEEAKPELWATINPKQGYYDKATEWFLEEFPLNDGEHIELMRLARSQIPDFNTYLSCLSEIHKRRRKYAKILAAQPMPTMVQVSPRSLVEYGTMEPEALASWLTWRKFFYDLDNRSAQETGYLFEPILAAAIGGEPKSARTKVVTRTGDRSKGRQVDCWKVMPDGTKRAYEFKLRVTIAASGQGRFGEELQFAKDCRNSEAVPILIVLDPTPNQRLDDLISAYENEGGLAYIGNAAWEHLEEEAGSTMAEFIERYVRKPVFEISSFEIPDDSGNGNVRLKLLDFMAAVEGQTLRLRFGDHFHEILRAEDVTQSSPEDDAGED